MFTGIIAHTAKVASAEKRGRNLAVSVAKPAQWRVPAGESISVNGICSTVVKAGRGVMHFVYMQETLQKTTAGSWRAGERVNLERSIKAGEPLDGHLVMGHVDGVGGIAVSVRAGRAQLLKIEAPRELLTLVVKKGSVAVDGVSLTVADVGEYWFSVALIPYTLAHTNLQFRKVGDRVNIETDILAKYIARATQIQSYSYIPRNVGVTKTKQKG